MTLDEYCKQDSYINAIKKKIDKGNQMFPIYVWGYRIVTILCLVIGVCLGTFGMENPQAFCFYAGIILIMISGILFIGMLLPGTSNTLVPYESGRVLAMQKTDLKEYEFDYFNEYLKSHKFVETYDLLNIPYQNPNTVYFLFEGEEHKMDISFLTREERQKIFSQKKIDLTCKFQWRFCSYSDIEDTAEWPIQFKKAFDFTCPNYKRF